MMFVVVLKYLDLLFWKNLFFIVSINKFKGFLMMVKYRFLLFSLWLECEF